jgi:hypothetical protein
MPSYDGVVRPVSKNAIRGIPVWHQQYGWVMIEDDQYPNPSLPRQTEDQRPQEIEKPQSPTALMYAVGSKADIEPNYSVDVDGRIQIFVQKEDNDVVNYLYCRQFNLKTGLIDFATYKLVTSDNHLIEAPSEIIETETSLAVPVLPDGLMDLFIDAVANLNSKLESIDNGIKEMRTNDKSGCHCEVSDSAVHG